MPDNLDLDRHHDPVKMICLPFELISLIIEELHHLDPKSVAPMCLVWPHATRFIQQTVFRSLTLEADDGHGPGAHVDDLLSKPPHITRLVHHLTIQRGSAGRGDSRLPAPTAHFFSQLPNLTSLSLSFLSFSAVEDLPSLFTALSRCSISSLNLNKCEMRLPEMNALFHHLLPRLRHLQMGSIFVDELFCHALQFGPAGLDFDDGHALQVHNPADRAYIYLDELCLYSCQHIIDTGILIDLYSSRQFSPLACVRKLVISSGSWTPIFVGRINGLVARATSDFSLECLEIRAESSSRIPYGIPPPIDAGNLKTLALYFPGTSGDTVDFLIWHISTLLNLPPTASDITITVHDLDGFVCNPRSESWLDLDAALCHPKFEMLEKLTICTTTKGFKLETVFPKAHAKFPRAFR